MGLFCVMLFVNFLVMCDVEQYLHSDAGSCLAGTNFVKKYGSIWEPHQFVFTNSYVDPVQIAAIVRIAVWQPNRFILNLAPIFFFKVAN